MHPAVELFIYRFRQEARERKQLRNELGFLEIAFLEKVWGPVFDYNFNGVTAEYPFRDYRGKQRFADIRFSDGITNTIIELDGYTTHARNITEEEYDDHTERQNDLLLKGWFLLRFSKGMIMTRAEVCQRQLMQAMGKWHYAQQSVGYTGQPSMWAARKAIIVKMAARDFVKPIHVAAKFQVSQRTGAAWLKKLAAEGLLEPIGGNVRITAYRLKGLDH